MPALDFQLPQLLALLPLALLPLLRRRRDALDFPWVGFLPRDAFGGWLHRLWQWLGLLTIVLVIIAVSGPGKSESRIERIGRGAEISILLDRSSSMDAIIRRNAPQPGESPRPTQTKNDVARGALSWLLQQRPENRYALTLFNVSAIRVAPFTDDPDVIQAGLDASDIGRGPSETSMGLGLLAAIEGFEGRDYTGSRAIMLVSDGGAKLDEELQAAIAQALKRNRISLYFIYIQSDPNSPNLELVGTDTDSGLDEVALHVFFAELDSEYRVFQAEDPESMAAAVRMIGQLQNQPLLYYERVPRIDYSRSCFVAALSCCLGLVGLSATRLERLT